MANFIIGTSGWHYDDWRGRFYPQKLPKSRWLEFYSQHFPTVEINNTFYRMPSETAVQGWHEAAPSGFCFAAKASRYITHIKRLKDTGEAITNFMVRIGGLEDRIGPILYQLPPNLHRDDAVLEAFVSQLPKDHRNVIEFRHDSWFMKEVQDILRRYGVGFCVFDMPDLTSPLAATADFAYVRFHGSAGLYSSSYPDEELRGWAKKLADLSSNLKAVYVYFNNDVGGAALMNAFTLREMLGK